MSDARPTTGLILTIAPELRPSDFHYHEAALVDGDRVWVICTEGVGKEVTDESPVTGRDGKVFTRTDIIALLADGTERETRPLESWIRTFGARLEGNFHLWFRTLMVGTGQRFEAECGEWFLSSVEVAPHEQSCRWCHESTDDYDELLDTVVA
jgi:hypothetical protein